MTPLLVTARLVAGLVASDPWSPSLDGILAWAWVRRLHGLDAMAATPDSAMAPVENLPLERVWHGEAWWYACSSPVVEAHARQRTHLHRRLDRLALERHGPAAIRRVEVGAGPLRDMRMPRMLTVTPSIAWHAVGDAAAVRALLAGVTHIGRDCARGRGEVAGWVVSEDGDAELARWRRPLPEAVALARGLAGPVLQWGLAPPARIGRVACVMP